MTNQTYLNQNVMLNTVQPKADSETDQVHRIIVQPAFRKNGRHHCENAGSRFISRFHDEIICTSTEPLFESARVLKARGFQGTIEMWSHGGTFPSMAMPIEQAAGLTVEEGERSPTLAKYKPFQTAPISRQATPVALGPKKALAALTAVQGIDCATALGLAVKSCSS